MAIRKPRTIVAAAGASLLLLGLVTGYLSIDAWSRHHTIGTPPFGWVDPYPMTGWERFWINFPSGYLLALGLAPLVIALVWVIVAAATKTPDTPR